MPTPRDEKSVVAFNKGQQMNGGVIAKAFKQLEGHPCWGLNHDPQVNLSLNFGKPSLDIREPFQTNFKSEFARRVAAGRRVTVRGEWWLWLLGCHWSLCSQNQRLATGTSSAKSIDRAIRDLDGQKLISVEVHSRTAATRFLFDLGGVLKCRRFDQDSAIDLWSLYKPTGYVLSVYGNGTFTHQRGTGEHAPHRRISDGSMVGS